MTSFIKAKLKKLDDHTNIDKYRVAANTAEYYHIISKLIFLRIIIKIHDYKAIIHVKDICEM